MSVYSRGSGPGRISGLAGRPTTPLVDKAESLITGLWDRPSVAEYWVSVSSGCQSPLKYVSVCLSGTVSRLWECVFDDSVSFCLQLKKAYSAELMH